MDGLITKTVKEVDNVKTGSGCRETRKRSGFSLRAVAKRMGVSAAYLSDLELGQRAWNTSRLFKYHGAIAKLRDSIAHQRRSREGRRNE